MNPSKELKRAINGKTSIKLISEVSQKELNELIMNAQINILPTFQETGIKLKLINALFLGRFCIVNTKMIRNTNLESLCLISDNPEQTKKLVLDYYKKEFNSEEFKSRAETLETLFDNTKNIDLLLEKYYS